MNYHSLPPAPLSLCHGVLHSLLLATTIYLTPVSHTATTHCLLHTATTHCYYTHCYYTLLLHTATTHCYNTLLLHTATTHCYYTLLQHTATTHCYNQCTQTANGFVLVPKSSHSTFASIIVSWSPPQFAPGNYNISYSCQPHCYYTLLLHTATTHCYYTHCYYTLLLHTATTHCYNTLLLHTATTHCYYTLLQNCSHKFSKRRRCYDLILVPIQSHSLSACIGCSSV